MERQGPTKKQNLTSIINQNKKGKLLGQAESKGLLTSSANRKSKKLIRNTRVINQTKSGEIVVESSDGAHGGTSGGLDASTVDQMMNINSFQDGAKSYSNNESIKIELLNKQNKKASHSNIIHTPINQLEKQVVSADIHGRRRVVDHLNQQSDNENYKNANRIITNNDTNRISQSAMNNSFEAAEKAQLNSYTNSAMKKNRASLNSLNTNSTRQTSNIMVGHQSIKSGQQRILGNHNLYMPQSQYITRSSSSIPDSVKHNYTAQNHFTTGGGGSTATRLNGYIDSRQQIGQTDVGKSQQIQALSMRNFQQYSSSTGKKSRRTMVSASQKHGLQPVQTIPVSEMVSSSVTPTITKEGVQLKKNLKNMRSEKRSLRLQAETNSLYAAPREILEHADQRNSKLQIQNYRIYQELKSKMEANIMRQRKALKASIQKFVPKMASLSTKHGKPSRAMSLSTTKTERRTVNYRSKFDKKVFDDPFSNDYLSHVSGPKKRGIASLTENSYVARNSNTASGMQLSAKHENYYESSLQP